MDSVYFFRDGTFFGFKDGKAASINKDLKFLKKTDFDGFYWFSYNGFVMGYKQEGDKRYKGMVDIQGNVIIEAEWSALLTRSFGLIEAWDGDGNEAIFDKNGTLLVGFDLITEGKSQSCDVNAAGYIRQDIYNESEDGYLTLEQSIYYDLQGKIISKEEAEGKVENGEEEDTLSYVEQVYNLQEDKIKKRWEKLGFDIFRSGGYISNYSYINWLSPDKENLDLSYEFRYDNVSTLKEQNRWIDAKWDAYLEKIETDVARSEWDVTNMESVADYDNYYLRVTLTMGNGKTLTYMYRYDENGNEILKHESLQDIKEIPKNRWENYWCIYSEGKQVIIEPDTGRICLQLEEEYEIEKVFSASNGEWGEIFLCHRGEDEKYYVFDENGRLMFETDMYDKDGVKYNYSEAMEFNGKYITIWSDERSERYIYSLEMKPLGKYTEFLKSGTGYMGFRFSDESSKEEGFIDLYDGELKFIKTIPIDLKYDSVKDTETKLISMNEIQNGTAYYMSFSKNDTRRLEMVVDQDGNEIIALLSNDKRSDIPFKIDNNHIYVMESENKIYQFGESVEIVTTNPPTSEPPTSEPPTSEPPTSEAPTSEPTPTTEPMPSPTPDASVTKKKQLSKPAKLRLTAKKATWKNVANNSGYTVKIMQGKKVVKTVQLKKGKTSYKVPKKLFKKGKKYKFTIVAKGKGKFKNSKLATSKVLKIKK